MNTIQHIAYVIEYLLLFYFGFSSLYFALFAIAALFYKEKKAKPIRSSYHTLILIPSYKEDNVIIESARQAVGHHSEHSTLDIRVIADSLKPETLQKLEETGVNLIPVSFNKSTKVKSLKYAIEHLPGPYDFVLILDADNIMAAGCVDELILKTEEGFRIVQGHRSAKNGNTNMAVLDGLSEEINNSIFRKGHRVIGLSSALIGSGFITEFALLKTFLSSSNAVGGFDKELELFLLKQRIRIAYANEALIYDEKVQRADAFVNQRRRWLAAQIIYLRKNFLSGLVHLLRYGKIDYFDKLIQFMLPPRIIALGITLLVSFIHLINNSITQSLSSRFLVWTSVVLLTAAAIAIAIPRHWFQWKYIKSFGSLPSGFIYTLLALLKSKGANKQFLHTPHGLSSNSIIQETNNGINHN